MLRDGASEGTVLEEQREHQLPRTGTVVDERFYIIKPLGQGAFCDVYAAVDLKAHCNVALKLMRDADSEWASRALQQEFAALSRVHHFHIAALLGRGRLSDGRRYLLTEHIDGPDMRAYINCVQLLDIPAAVELTEQILEGMEHAHSRGVIHRDLKPENIILTDDGLGGTRAVVVDFGIALLLGENEASARPDDGGMTIGTPRYMAPEQLLLGPVSAATDLYAVGLMLLELITGRPSFRGLREIQGAQVNNVIAVPDYLEGHPIAPVVKKATSANASARHQSASEMLMALREAIAASARDSPPAPRRMRRPSSFWRAQTVVKEKEEAA